VRHAP